MPAYEERGLCYAQLCQPHWVHTDPSLYYGFWGSCMNDYRDTEPHAGYAVIKHWKEKYFTDTPAAGQVRDTNNQC